MRKTIASLLITLLATGALAAPTDTLTQAVQFLIDREPGHPRAGDRAYAAQMARALRLAGDRYDLDPWLLAAMAAFESRYRPDIISGKTRGKAGEVGLLQCGKDCARACPHFMDTVEGQALCGARWMRQAMDACAGGDARRPQEWRALVMYASGHYCDPPADTPFAWRATKRARLRDRLLDRFASR